LFDLNRSPPLGIAGNVGRGRWHKKGNKIDLEEEKKK
jgi:hypothetical protein